MTEAERRKLRPMQAVAGKSLSLEEAGDLIGQLNQASGQDYDGTELSSVFPEIDLDEAMAEAEALQQGGEHDPLTATPYDTLFGPHASTFSAEQKHWAAWWLYLAWDAATEGDSGLAGALRELHQDNGYGYCAGCGANEVGIYLVALPDCPSLALLEGAS